MFQVPRPSLALALVFMLSPSRVLAAQASDRKPLTTPTATCPIQLKLLELHRNHLQFEYRNSTDKLLQGIVFGLAYYDSVQDPHRVMVVGGVDKRLPPGKLMRSELDISYWRNSGYAGWTLWPSKILFSDGSTWKMGNESTACSIVNWLDRQITPPPLPSAVLNMPPEYPHEGR